MTYDTTKDPRILVAHLASALMKKCVKQKTVVQIGISREKLVELAMACESSVMTLMYMYQEPKILVSSDPMVNLAKDAKHLTDAYKRLIESTDDHSLLRANVRWCLRIFNGLEKRFQNSGASLAAGIDHVCIQVRNRVKSGAFLKTIVSDNIANYIVMTNLKNIEPNSKLAVSFLPPRDIGGIVSEAMFLGDQKRTEPPGTAYKEEQLDVKDAAAILYDEITKHHK